MTQVNIHSMFIIWSYIQMIYTEYMLFAFHKATLQPECFLFFFLVISLQAWETAATWHIVLSRKFEMLIER